MACIPTGQGRRVLDLMQGLIRPTPVEIPLNGSTRVEKALYSDVPLGPILP